MPDELFSRRLFLHRLTFLGGGVLLFGPACRRLEKSAAGPVKLRAPKILTSSHRTFTDEEFLNMSAACDRVLPRDQDPGAVEAGVPEYIDRMLQTPELHQMRDDFLHGLAALNRRAQRTYGGSFATRTNDQKDALLTAFRDSAPDSGEAHFFETLMVLTLEGFLGDPSYGGNKDRVGWALVGFDTSMPADYQPPAGSMPMHHAAMSHHL